MEENRRDAVLGNMVRAIHILEECRFFAPLIPEVRTNLVYALPNACTQDAVAGVDGRITSVKGYPKAAGYPTLGASSHMARFIIEVIKRDGEIRAGINFMHNDTFGQWLEEYCKKNGLLLGWIDRSKEPEARKEEEGGSMVWKVAEAIRSVDGQVPDIAYETGAVGKEPVSVLLGRSAVDVVKGAIRLSETYAKNRKD